ncbi:MAG TPA: hypothetical protein VLA72_07750 [Anaerolineales bacterium]|nr:hypothetical protein [Anaerolineales bacterium]
MFILITIGILLASALGLLILQFLSPDYRYTWLLAAGGALIAWISLLFWQIAMPITVQFPLWQPENIFNQSPIFIADGISWAFAQSIGTICLGVIVTAVARDNFPSPVSWIGIFLLSAFGILAVTAENPLTLVLLWAAIDLSELISQMRFVEDPKLSERVVVSFATRVTGTLILLLASMVSASNGSVLNFHSPAPSAGLYLVLAAGLRLGIFPLHLPYSGDSAIRRGFGTGLRMISAGSSLILLARVPFSGVESPITPFLMIFTSFAALYGGWMWLRSPNELTGRPFWLIGLGSLAVASALRGNPIGATAWSCALILSGGALFLASAQSRWLEKILFIGLWGATALPFSLTANGWINSRTGFWYAIPPLLIAQAFLLAGYFRQSQRISARTDFEDQPIWARNVYPFGIYIILFTAVLLGFFGWSGSLGIGNWLAGLVASLLTFGLLWLTPRLRILNPVRAHWVRPTDNSWMDTIYQLLWSLYRQLGRGSKTFSSVLEGEGGIMWTLLFLALFISMFIQRTP